MLCLKNPGCRKCKTCVSNIKKEIDNIEYQECTAHGPMNKDIKYHLYSLDKLSQHKGTYLDDEEMVSHGKKRKQLSLFRCMKLAKNNHGNRMKRDRKSGFMFSSLSCETNIRKHMRKGWDRVCVSVPNEGIEDTLASNVMISPFILGDKLLGGVVGETIRLAETLYYSIYDILREKNLRAGDERLDISLECSATPHSILIYKKALLLVNDLLALDYSTSVYVTLWTDVPEDLEEMNLHILQEISNLYSTERRNTQRLFVTETGDGVLDIVSNVNGQAIPIITSCSSIPYMNRSGYLLTTAEMVYQTLEKTSEHKVGKFSWSVLTPSSTVVSPMPCILKFVKKQTNDLHVSDALVMKALREMPCVQDDGLCDELSVYHLVTGSSPIVWTLYQECVRIQAGITSFSIYNLVIGRLHDRLRSTVLSSRSDERLAWQCSSIIRIIMAIRILTHEDSERALKYYTSFSSFSYKPGTYRTILLHRGSRKDPHMRKLINWTPGSLGEKLKSTYEDMRCRLEVTWSSNHDMRRSITI
uniref:RNA-dependent RNA polyermaser n=1 Tax=Sowthistle yellow vein virus TaxID=2358214 RepID=A0A386JTA0_9RHAB|nr:RNA-dependent RNA polyermaser [Sowthistle yellow vein virus]